MISEDFIVNYGEHLCYNNTLHHWGGKECLIFNLCYICFDMFILCKIVIYSLLLSTLSILEGFTLKVFTIILQPSQPPYICL